jgi:hypothetical protein
MMQPGEAEGDARMNICRNAARRKNKVDAGTNNVDDAGDVQRKNPWERN